MLPTPDRPLQTEVLIAQFHRDGPRRYRHMRHLQARQSLPDQLLDVRGRAGFGKLRRPADQVGFTHV